MSELNKFFIIIINIMSKYYIFYSELCKYCEEFLTELHKKNLDLYRSFDKICIDNKNIKIPQYVKEVPSIIIPINGKNNLLAGNAAFNWLKQLKSASIPGSASTESSSAGPSEYDPYTMSGFSDNYGYYDKNETTAFNNLDNIGKISSDERFSLINNPQQMLSEPPRDDDLKSNNKLKEDSAKRKMEDLMAQRNRDVKPMPQRVGGVGPTM